MSGDGFTIDPDAVAQTGTRFAALSDKADGILNKVQEAAVPEISWGLLGLATTYACYVKYLAEYTEHLREAVENFRDAGELIQTAAKTYTSAQQDVVRAIEDLGRKLSEVGDAPTTNA